MSVPTPSSVSTSSNKACSTRPSIICTVFTPLLAASRAELILGSIPPLNVPSPTNSSICFGVKPVNKLPALSKTPGVLVSRISFSAPKIWLFTCHYIGIDIKGFAMFTHTNWRHHGYEITTIQKINNARVNGCNFTHLTNINHF